MASTLENFKKLSAIPRGSGNESAVADMLEAFAAERGLSFYRDAEQNVLITKAGVGKTVILQGHSDMVCEKNDGVEHDFERDGIETVEESGVIRANGTTLGADDGVSIAVMMKILDDPTITVPIECLVTAKEEIGLLGMGAFDFSRLTGRAMINLDSTDEGEATVSCCGGVRTDITIPAQKSAADGVGYELRVRGLYGGHSGEDINLGRRNAILTALKIIRKVEGVRLAFIEGGSKDNAIPRECTIRFATADDAAEEKIAAATDAIRDMLILDDKDFSAVLEKVDVPETFGEELFGHLRTLAAVIPLGVIRMDPDIEGLVHTSANFAIARTEDDCVKITISSRSSEDAVLDELTATADKVAADCGGSAEHRGRYPGWAFAPESELRELYVKTFDDLFGALGKKARIKGIHAGLECGLVKAAIPDMDIISIGPNIKSCHSPEETLDAASLERMYELVAEMLRRMA